MLPFFFFFSFKTTLLVSFTYGYGPWRTGAIVYWTSETNLCHLFQDRWFKLTLTCHGQNELTKSKIGSCITKQILIFLSNLFDYSCEYGNLKFEWDSDRHSTGRSIPAQHLVMICTFIFFLFLIKKTNQCFCIYPNSTFAKFQSD